MKTLGIMQNQWFKDPEWAKSLMQKYAERGKPRHIFIRDMLFFSCFTGKKLLKTFGEDLCDYIIWEEVSPKISSHSSSSFPPDIEHLKSILKEHNPDVVITFGKIAKNGLSNVSFTGTVINCPHPAARGSGIDNMLIEAATSLALMLNKIEVD